ncbi:MAG: FKBP-type peptidyl-prolyl cis-trans isomerase [Pirellulaceae bacterium]
MLDFIAPLKKSLCFLVPVVVLTICACAPASSDKQAASSSKQAATPGPIDADAANEFTTTDSGLKYRILRKADGPKPTADDWVEVHYAGTLDDQSEFDSSYQRGSPFSTALTQVIPGWTEGLQLVNRGGMIELEIPAELGYGSRGAGGAIPPNATLHFTIELLNVFTVDQYGNLAAKKAVE